MIEIRELWPAGLPPIPEGDIELVRGVSEGALAEAGCCFWLFRFLHRVESPAAVLMGDYCFGRFSAHLARIDSVELTNAFAAYLKDDILFEGDIGEYLKFIKNVSRTTKL